MIWGGGASGHKSLVTGTSRERRSADQDLRRDAVALANEAEQDVLGADGVVIERPGFPLRQDDHLPRQRRRPA